MANDAERRGSVEACDKTLNNAAAMVGWNTPRATDGTNGGPSQANGALSADAAKVLGRLVGWPTPATPSGGRSVSIDKMDATGRTTDGRKHTATLEHAVKFVAGWPTPKAQRPDQATHYSRGNPTLAAVAELVGWPTVTARDFKNVGTPESYRRRVAAGKAQPLPEVAQLAGWPTPTVLDRPRNPETLAKCLAFRKRNANQNTVPLYLGEVAAMAGWPTAKPADGDRGGTAARVGGRRRNLVDYAQAAGWPSPKASNSHGAGTRGEGGADLQTAALGTTPSSSPARTGSGGVLAPEFSLWLMGFPEAWQRSAPNWGDWRRWQDFMAETSERRRPTASESSRARATPSCPGSPLCSFALIWEFLTTAPRSRS